MGGVTECIFGLDCLETKQRGIVMICHNLGLVRNVRLEVASSWYRMLVVLMGLMSFDEDPMIRLSEYAKRSPQLRLKQRSISGTRVRNTELR